MENKLMTPKCKANYIWLFEPNNKFGSVYSVTCLIDENDHEWAQLINHMTTEYNNYYNSIASMNKGKKPKKCEYFPWKEVDGVRVFVAKNNAVINKKDGTTVEWRPVVYGPDREVLDASELKGRLGNGTELRVGFSMNLWQNDAQGVGVSARLTWAQIINPKYYDPFDGFGGGPTIYPKDPTLFNALKPKGSKVVEVTHADEIVEDGIVYDDLFTHGKKF